MRRLLLWGCGFLLAVCVAAAQNLHLWNTSVSSGTVTYDDASSISAASYVVTGSANVSFAAAIQVTLQPGFRALAGSTFAARIATGGFLGTVATPAASPGAGTYSGPQTVTLSTTTNGATIRYTTDGSLPSESTGTSCSSPCSVVVNTNLVLNAIGVESGWGDSAIQSVEYAIGGCCTSLSSFIACVGPSGSSATCTLPTGTYTITNSTGPIVIGRSNVIVSGGSIDRTQTKIVRDPTLDTNLPEAQYLMNGFTQPIIQVDLPAPVSGIVIQNLTICGSNTLTLGSSPVGCPRVLNTCGAMVAAQTTAANNQQPAPCDSGGHCDFTCSDMYISSADTGLNTTVPEPFNYSGFDQYGGPYSVEISNVDFEDATGDAITMWESNNQKVNDIYIHNSAVNNSGVTGILAGAGTTYYDKYCDGYAANAGGTAFADAASLFAPRNIRIESTTFQGNNTGAIGFGAIRWLGLRGDTFTNNYNNPQVGNRAGGTVAIDRCADEVEISGNTFTGPAAQWYTSALELYGRNVNVHNNSNISGYGVEGISVGSMYSPTLNNNDVHDNDWSNGRPVGQGYTTGGIKVVTSFSTGGCDGARRDTQNVTISGNTISGQPYGIHFADQQLLSTDTLSGVTLGSNSLSVLPGGYLLAIDPTVTVAPNPGATLTAAPFPPTPMALCVDSGSWSHNRCSAPGGQAPAIETFTFPVKENQGPDNVAWIQGIFSISGSDTNGANGPDNGAYGCHFLYYPPPTSVIYLDGPNGGFNWVGSSIVGPGGSNLTNGYCTIHAGPDYSSVSTGPFVLTLSLGIEFPTSSSSSSNKHIYSITWNADTPPGKSDGGMWTYWGWWATQ